MANAKVEWRGAYVRLLARHALELRAGFERLEKKAARLPGDSGAALSASMQAIRPVEAEALECVLRLATAGDADDRWETARSELERAFGRLHDGYARAREAVD